MTNKTTQIRKDIERTLERQGAQDITFGRDGSGHQTTTFSYKGRVIHFHFASTGKMRGASYLNVMSRLRRKMREAEASKTNH